MGPSYRIFSKIVPSTWPGSLLLRELASDLGMEGDSLRRLAPVRAETGVQKVRSLESQERYFAKKVRSDGQDLWPALEAWAAEKNGERSEGSTIEYSAAVTWHTVVSAILEVYHLVHAPEREKGGKRDHLESVRQELASDKGDFLQRVRASRL